MIKYWNKKIKKLDAWDIGLTKLAVAAFVLWVITLWPAAMTLVQSINPWYFFVAFLVFAARVWYKTFLK